MIIIGKIKILKQEAHSAKDGNSLAAEVEADEALQGEVES